MTTKYPRSPLSSADLALFFDAEHQALATELSDVMDYLENTHPDAADAGPLLGERFDLCRWLVPESGVTDVRALCLIREALGYACPLLDAIFAVQGLFAYTVQQGAQSAQHKSIVAQARAGRVIGGFGLTEPNAGSDVRSMETRAVAEGNDYILNGEKTFISNVGIADFYVIFAQLDEAISAFLVPAQTPGLTELSIPMSVDHPIGRLQLQNCRIPQSARLGDIGQGFELAMNTLNTFRVSVGAAAVGMARRALDEAIGHVKQRVQFGKPLARQQMVQAKIADMATELDAARLLVLRAAHARDTGAASTTLPVSMAKMFATEAAQRIVDQAVQLFGGLGVVDGTVVERLYREIRPLRIYEGTTEIQRLIISRGLLK